VELALTAAGLALAGSALLSLAGVGPLGEDVCTTTTTVERALPADGKDEGTQTVVTACRRPGLTDGYAPAALVLGAAALLPVAVRRLPPGTKAQGPFGLSLETPAEQIKQDIAVALLREDSDAP
jgi:hypothetical protein